MRIKKISSHRFTTRPSTGATPWTAAIAEANDYAMSLYARTHLHF